jgi:hypothetical protein
MKQFNEQPEDASYARHGFWDFWLIGGRWAGHKLIAKYDEAKLDEFYEWLDAENITVLGLQCGKQELAPDSQIPKVDAKWNEMFPSSEFLPCPLFKHSNDQYGKGISGTLPGDVQRLADVPERLKCSRVIFARPSYSATSDDFTGPLEAEFMLVDEEWNGCNHMKVDWDGTFHSALQKYRESFENYRENFKAKIAPTDDWLVVTVDYHS